jgi:hypothetical protein
VPIGLMGDFNIDISDEKNELAEFLAREFKIHHHTNALPTTLGNTCIDNEYRMYAICLIFQLSQAFTKQIGIDVIILQKINTHFFYHCFVIKT